MKINLDMLNEAIVSTKGTGTKKTYSLNYVNAIDDRVTTNSSNISSILSDNVELHKYTNWYRTQLVGTAKKCSEMDRTHFGIYTTLNDDTAPTKHGTND